jgi:hypothetical protein
MKALLLLLTLTILTGTDGIKYIESDANHRIYAYAKTQDDSLTQTVIIAYYYSYKAIDDTVDWSRDSTHEYVLTGSNHNSYRQSNNKVRYIYNYVNSMP